MNASFNTITIEDALKEIIMVNSSKAIQVTDTPLKVIKENSNFYGTNMHFFQ